MIFVLSGEKSYHLILASWVFQFVKDASWYCCHTSGWCKRYRLLQSPQLCFVLMQCALKVGEPFLCGQAHGDDGSLVSVFVCFYKSDKVASKSGVLTLPDRFYPTGLRKTKNSPIMLALKSVASSNVCLFSALRVSRVDESPAIWLCKFLVGPTDLFASFIRSHLTSSYTSSLNILNARRLAVFSCTACFNRKCMFHRRGPGRSSARDMLLGTEKQSDGGRPGGPAQMACWGSKRGTKISQFRQWRNCQCFCRFLPVCWFVVVCSRAGLTC